jgi:hypothetical protein
MLRRHCRESSKATNRHGSWLGGWRKMDVLLQRASGLSDRSLCQLTSGLRHRASSRSGRKKSRMSSASLCGSSIAAKCPPRGISVQRCTLKKRSAHLRGGVAMSFGKSANAPGVRFRSARLPDQLATQCRRVACRWRPLRPRRPLPDLARAGARQRETGGGGRQVVGARGWPDPGVQGVTVGTLALATCSTVLALSALSSPARFRSRQAAGQRHCAIRGCSR